ncbi:hypothetical protein C2I06_22500 [Niallia circulans]|uniref:hypothetical protein n=1 Tax=Niallia circulans TaxID=1397 RepID=UPI000F44E35D|nr:hypothetical protein [Niallia circulans]AYV69393.1 hypothetical protein C2I06_22500 [Niallia circulans]
MILMENGLFDIRKVKESKLPVFDFTENENTGIPITFWTFTDLKRIGWKLNDEQRMNMIVGFVKTSKRMRGYSGLYDFCKVMELFCGYTGEYKAST